MRELNCNGLKKLKVPDELIDKALAIPTALGTARAAVRPLRRMIAAAAVFLVTVVGVSVYFISRNIDNVPLAAPPATEMCRPASDPSEDGIAEPTAERIFAPSLPPTEQPSAPAVPAAAQSEAPTRSVPAQTEPPRQAESDVPDVVTAPPEDSPAQPAANPTEEPTEPAEYTEPATDKEIASVGYMVPISSYSGSEDLYCRLYSSSGRLIGSGDLYDESRRVYFTTGSGYLFLSYPLGALVEPLPPDNYTIIFYDADGNDFYICSAFLSKR